MQGNQGTVLETDTNFLVNSEHNKGHTWYLGIFFEIQKYFLSIWQWSNIKSYEKKPFEIIDMLAF